MDFNSLSKGYGRWKASTISDRFWKKVNKTDGCWEWTAYRAVFGHGVFRVGDNNYLAHRLSWEMKNGEIPEGLWVLHKCDNPACVNPDHLYLGTVQDNNRDRMERGRKGDVKGELNGRAKLTWPKVREIRQKYKSINIKALAMEYKVSQATIYFIVNDITWRE